MRTEHAPTILRSDYRPLAYTVEAVDLHFTLDPTATVVRNRMQVVRNPAVPVAPLLLNAEGLERLALLIDGAEPAPDRWRETADGIEVDLCAERATIEVVTRIAPDKNTTLSGLYVSRGGFFTQCEAQGFRRITCFPDRPDVMARYTVTLEADAAACPVLLANGNLIDQGALPDGRHFARWEDPFPKPCYLFAVVAASLVCLERQVQTASGRDVLLQVWVEDGQLDRTAHAMDSLLHALRWDEAKFGLELDLDRFMIVAVSDFNMGAMENKGLNIFNSKFVLANPKTATDVDYEGIESVVAHEYFHNWTGNRVTCRDWFQLTLKEGLTVFRDQQFSADMLAAAAGGDTAAANSARAVVRIDCVRVLRAAQFAEDAGPMAHPIRPESYQEINNFYTATVYEKGAEVIRMLRTLLGEEGFRSGMDLYFEYHDGQAVTCDDFVAAMADASGRNLDQFMRWYGQAGTPRLVAGGRYDPAARTYTLQLRQYTPPTPGQSEKLPLHMPVAVGLIGPDGADLPLRFAGEGTSRPPTTRLLELIEAEQSWTFVDLDAAPVPSLLRGYSAPVIVELAEDDATLAFRMAHDSDPFNRWDAGQRFAERVVLERGGEADAAFLDAYRRLLADAGLDPAFRAVALTLPSEATLLERMQPADPAVLRAAQVRLTRRLGAELRGDWRRLYDGNVVGGPYRYHPADAGRRALANLALRFLCAAGDADGFACAERQFAAAGNMTERFGALVALVHSTAPQRDAALAAFEAGFRDDALVLDKWFALQAAAWNWGDAAAEPTLARVQRLMQHPAFTVANPNKVYALLGSFFRGNAAEFHDEAGAGYAFWAEQIARLDALNPQVAARMARALERWRHFTPPMQARIRSALERLAATPKLSADVREIVDKALA